MFVAGKMFETAEEAKTWMESQTTLDERRGWTLLVIAVPPERPLTHAERPSTQAIPGNPKTLKVDFEESWRNAPRLTDLSKVRELGQALIDAEEKHK